MPTLTPGQLDHYRENGYVFVEDLLDPATDLSPVLRECDQVLADLDFDARLCQIYNETGQVHAHHFDISLQQGGINADTPIAVGPAAFAALRNEKLLDILKISSVLKFTPIPSNTSASNRPNNTCPASLKTTAAASPASMSAPRPGTKTTGGPA